MTDRHGDARAGRPLGRLADAEAGGRAEEPAGDSFERDFEPEVGVADGAGALRI
jgi:hypothetical protein